MRKAFAVILLVVGAATILAVSAFARGGDEKNSFKATLNGYNEVVGGAGPASTGSVSTGVTLTYSGIEGGTVTQAHPHFAQNHVPGGIFGFFCGGPKPACPSPGGTVEGTWTAADIIGPADQGVQAAAFDEFVRALRAGAVYVNVHSSGATPSYPEGEIRGQVSSSNDD